ncbi:MULTISPECIES: hypothetical protein [unclassified Aeromicrobium]|uniref:hypothetical protein n=1 Tax=unclassified Aeromicrobium TaxID=2633570 RepID=UPI00288A83E1|nr:MULTISPECIES: hypothetical protein [unclassified Aeromicrobium]
MEPTVPNHPETSTDPSKPADIGPTAPPSGRRAEPDELPLVDFVKRGPRPQHSWLQSEDRWLSADLRYLRVFTEAANTHSAHAKQDWQIFCVLVSGLYIFFGLLVVGLDVTSTATSIAIAIIAALTISILVFRLFAVRTSQRWQRDAVMWRAARDGNERNFD